MATQPQVRLGASSGRPRKRARPQLVHARHMALQICRLGCALALQYTQGHNEAGSWGQDKACSCTHLLAPFEEIQKTVLHS